MPTLFQPGPLEVAHVGNSRLIQFLPIRFSSTSLFPPVCFTVVLSTPFFTCPSASSEASPDWFVLDPNGRVVQAPLTALSGCPPTDPDKVCAILRLKPACPNAHSSPQTTSSEPGRKTWGFGGWVWGWTAPWARGSDMGFGVKSWNFICQYLQAARFFAEPHTGLTPGFFKESPEPDDRTVLFPFQKKDCA